MPSPKPGRPYASGLEHAELAVRMPPAAFVRWCEARGALAEFAFDTRASAKPFNADVAIAFDDAAFGAVSVKFHERPIDEVVAIELAEAAEAEAAAVAAGGPRSTTCQ